MVRGPEDTSSAAGFAAFGVRIELGDDGEKSYSTSSPGFRIRWTVSWSCVPLPAAAFSRFHERIRMFSM